MKNEALIKKWLTDQLTEEEEKLLKETDEFAEIEKIWDGLTVATPPVFDVTEELERFHASHQKPAKVVKVSWHKQLAGIAASLILIAVIGYLMLRPSSDSRTVTFSEGLSAFYLPDSSMITLNKGSELVYDTKEWAALRKVWLKGEGFFQVKPGATFEVVTADGTVSVLGTSFNIKQRENYYEVICYEGKVGVATTQKNLTLSAGDGYREGSGQADQFQITVGERPAWLDGQSSFFRTPYHVVLEELENQYEITIETQNLALEQTFTGSFPNNNLDVALEAVTIPSGYLYQITDDKVLIKGEQQ